MHNNPRSGRAIRPDFSFLWGAHTASIFGSNLTMVAIPLLAIALLDAGAFDLSLLTAANLAPYLVAGLFVGIWVDRVRKRPLMFAADLGRAAFLLVLVLLAWRGGLTLIQVLAITVGLGFMTVVFNVADTSFLPSIIERADLPHANARLALSTSVARIAGPAAAGAIIGLISESGVLIVGAALYLISALLIGKIRTEGVSTALHVREPIATSLSHGFRTLRGIPVLSALVFSAAFTSMFGIAFQTLLLIFLVDRFGLDAPRIGLLLAAGGAGAVCGSLLSGRMVRSIGVGRSIVTAQALFGVMGMILPLALIVPERTAPAVIAVSLFTQLAFNTVREVNGAALSQAVIPPEVLGRTQSTSLVLIKTFEVFGSLVAGGLALAFGTSVAIVLLLIGMLLSIAPMIGSGIPAIATLDDVEAGS